MQMHNMIRRADEHTCPALWCSGAGSPLRRLRSRWRLRPRSHLDNSTDMVRDTSQTSSTKPAAMFGSLAKAVERRVTASTCIQINYALCHLLRLPPAAQRASRATAWQCAAASPWHQSFPPRPPVPTAHPASPACAISSACSSAAGMTNTLYCMPAQHRYTNASDLACSGRQRPTGCSALEGTQGDAC